MKKYILALVSVSALMSDPRAQEIMRVQNGGILTVQSGTTLTLAGGITLDNGSQLSNNGSIVVKQNGVSGSADWTDGSTTTYNYGAGTVIFSSVAPQAVNSSNLFGQINVNNAGLNLGSDILANNWYLVNGTVNTGAFKAITPSAVQTAFQADPGNPGYSKSWVNGTIRRYIAPASVNSYDFPVGTSVQNNLVTLDSLTIAPLINTSYLDVSFGAKPGTDSGLSVTENGVAYTAVNNGGVWYITPDVAPGGGQYDLLVYFNGFSGLTDNQFAILERPDSSSNAADWMVPAGSTLFDEGLPGRIVSSGFARRNRLSAFGQSGIGMTNSPLPGSGFYAERMNKALVMLSWEPKMEGNSGGFIVERRLDGQPSFTSIGYVPPQAPGSNSANPLTYSFADTNSYAGVSYYRLKQQGPGGQTAFTVIKAVPGIGGTRLSVLLYPNPSHGEATLRVEGIDKEYTVVITDESGRTVRTVEGLGDNNTIISGLRPGLYFVWISDLLDRDRPFSYVEKLVIVP